MYRDAMKSLLEWKADPKRKPLIIQGARQVGKTWLMREFGKKEFQKVVYINFDHNETMRNLFETDLDVRRILTGLSLYSSISITPGDTLLLFDEVQEVPNALASLKYFYEDAAEYPVICAGALLGIALHPGTSFPVGKVSFLQLYPLSFTEFLRALDMEPYADLLEQCDTEMISAFRTKYIDALKMYYFVGGMPEAVADYAQRRDLQRVRVIQSQILASYGQDYSKHAPAQVVPRIRAVWESIPSQLAKENKKFIYGLVREGARAKEYETAILWLCDCGLVYKIGRIIAPRIPLKAYEDLKSFKMYCLDVGLLSCMAGLESRTLVEGNRLFTEFKGALTEQYVCQQLKTDSKIRDSVYYYTNERNTSEIDFVLSLEGNVVPLEVKAEENLRAKSLQAFKEKYGIPLSIRLSMSDYRRQGWLLNVPLYMADELSRLIHDSF